MNIRRLRALSVSMLACGQLTANPTDSSVNTLLMAESVKTRVLPASEGSEVTVTFDKAIDALGVENIANYSLRQLAPELGLKSSGGTLEDLDGDGDLDMVLALNYRIVAYENVGSAVLPRFALPEHHLATVYRYDFPNQFSPTGGNLLANRVSVSFCDLNGDDTRDMICGEISDGQVTCFLRDGSTGWPQSSAFGLQKQILRRSPSGWMSPIHLNNGFLDEDQLPSVTLEHLDGDGILDLVVGDPWQHPSTPGPIIGPNPYPLFNPDSKNVLVYRGTGDFHNGSPVFLDPVALRANGQEIRVDQTFAGATCPLFFDVDGDSDNDLLVSTSSGKIWIFKRIGIETNTTSDNFGLPRFEKGYQLADSSGNPIELGRVSSLQKADFSNDGDLDLVVVSRSEGSSQENRLMLFENASSTGLNISGEPLDVGVSDFKQNLRSTIRSKPCYFDFDSDGKLDLLYANEGFGLSISYNLDTGRNHDPTFGDLIELKSTELLGDLLSDGVPDIADFDGDKILDPQVDGLLIGTKMGLVFMRYAGLQDDGLPRFEDPISLIQQEASVEKFYQPTVGDVNGDGTLDVVCGMGVHSPWSDGSLRVFYNSTSNGFNLSASMPLLVNGQSNSVAMFPELVDYDGDGDSDILVSNRTSYSFYPDLADAYVGLLRNDAGGFVDGGRIQTDDGGDVWVSTEASPRAVDFDMDGRLDLMVAAGNSEATPFLTDTNSSGVGLVLLHSSEPPILSSLDLDNSSDRGIVVTSTHPVSAKLDSTRKKLTLKFPTIVQVGSRIDLNDLYVNGLRCAIIGQEILDLNTGADTDGDGLPDAWEEFYGFNPNEMDSDDDGITDDFEDLDGDGFNSIQEWALRTDPRDFYNGAKPKSLNLVVESGGYQKGEPDQTFPKQLKLRVLDPVTERLVAGMALDFSVVRGQGLLSASSDVDGDQTSMRIYSDSDGYATVYLKAGSAAEAAYQISANYLGATTPPVLFHAQVGSDLLAKWNFEEDSSIVQVADDGPWELDGLLSAVAPRSQWTVAASNFDPNGFTTGILNFGQGPGSVATMDALSSLIAGFGNHDAMSVAFWFNNGAVPVGTPGDFHSVVSWSPESSEGGVAIGFDHAGGLGVRATSGGATVKWKTGEVWRDNSWHHVVVMFDRSRMKLSAFVDNQAAYLGRAATGGSFEAVAYSEVADLTEDDWQAIVSAGAGNSVHLGTNGSEHFTGKLDSVTVVANTLDSAARAKLAKLGDASGVLPNSIADQDFDGVSNRDEFLRGTDHTDYFNGKTPKIEILSGDGQSGGSGVLAEPVVVLVSDGSGRPLPNAPIFIKPQDPAARWSVVDSGSSPATPSGYRRADSQGFIRLIIQP